MGSGTKRKFNIDLNKITSGIDLKDTVKNLTESEKASEIDRQKLRTYKEISFQKLKSSPLNDYPIVAVEEMENLILAYGLLEPLNVIYVEEEDTYEIESGDRRFHALQNLYQKYERENLEIDRELYESNVHLLFVKGIPCMVENNSSSEDDRRARIIIHNESNRPFDPIRTSARLAELATIYTKQNSDLPPNSKKINVNERIAQELNGRYSVRQIIRYKNFDALADDLKDVAVKYELNLSAISNYHTLNAFEQSVLAKYIDECYSAGKRIDLPTIAEIKDIVNDTMSPSTEQESSSDMMSLVKEQESSSDTMSLDKEQESSSDTMSLVKEQESSRDTMSLVKEQESNSDTDLNLLKNRAAKKILEHKDKKENKVKDTLADLLKKTSILEKAVVILKGTEASDSDLDDIISDINEITGRLDAIKTSIHN